MSNGSTCFNDYPKVFQDLPRCDLCGQLLEICWCAGVSIECPLLELWDQGPNPIALREIVTDEAESRASAERVIQRHFAQRVQARVDEARALTANHKAISWLYFNFTGKRSLKSLLEFVQNQCWVTKTYVGVTTSPLWRFSGITDSEKHSNRSVPPHNRKGYTNMYVLESGHSREIGKLESTVISSLKSLLQNKVGGGGGIRNSADAIYFFYVVNAA